MADTNDSTQQPDEEKTRSVQEADTEGRRTAPAPYWHQDPFGLMQDFDQIFSDFYRSFDDLLWPMRSYTRSPTRTLVFQRPRRWVDRVRRAPTTRQQSFRQPSVDIKDAGNEFVLTAELPGISKDDIDIKLRDDSVEIKAETKTQHETDDDESGYFYKERSYSSFYRSLPLPETVVPTDATAELKDGVLNLTIPKRKPTEDEGVHKVKIN